MADPGAWKRACSADVSSWAAARLELTKRDRVALAAFDLVGRQLVVRDRIEALDALRHLAVRDAGNLELVHADEIGDLAEGQRRVVEQPDGGRLGHERQVLNHVRSPSEWKRGLPGPKTGAPGRGCRFRREDQSRP